MKSQEVVQGRDLNESHLTVGVSGQVRIKNDVAGSGELEESWSGSSKRRKWVYPR